MSELQEAVASADTKTIHGNADEEPCIGASGYVNRRAAAMLGVTDSAMSINYTEHPSKEGDLLFWAAPEGYKISPVKGQNGASVTQRWLSEKMRVVDTGEDHPETEARIYRLTPHS